jgi:hypothetical protein
MWVVAAIRKIIARMTSANCTALVDAGADFGHHVRVEPSAGFGGGCKLLLPLEVIFLPLRCRERLGRGLQEDL